MASSFRAVVVKTVKLFNYSPAADAATTAAALRSHLRTAYTNGLNIHKSLQRGARQQVIAVKKGNMIINCPFSYSLSTILYTIQM